MHRGTSKKVSLAFGVPIDEHGERDFKDGEHKTRPLVSVRGGNVSALQNLNGNTQGNANDKLCKLPLFIADCRENGASRDSRRSLSRIRTQGPANQGAGSCNDAIRGAALRGGQHRSGDDARCAQHCRLSECLPLPHDSPECKAAIRRSDRPKSCRRARRDILPRTRRR